MWFHGVDFTSAPSRAKPIVVVSSETEIASALVKLDSLDAFEEWLSTAEGMIGIDSPLGFPAEFCSELFPGMDWTGLARELAKIGPNQSLRALEEKVAAFRDARPLGSKEPKRLTDVDSGAFSAIKFGRPAVGRMAARLMPILERCGHSILPVRPTEAATTVVEVFPGKLVREVIGRLSYKGKGVDAEIRVRIMHVLDLRASVGIERAAVDDEEGDVLDALAALRQVQAWHSRGCPMPTTPTESFEGWIV